MSKCVDYIASGIREYLIQLEWELGGKSDIVSQFQCKAGENPFIIEIDHWKKICSEKDKLQT